MDKTIAILAAGIGSRYGGLKQMDPIGPSGEFIIDYSIYDALRAGFDSVIFIIRKYFAEEFRETIGERVSKHAQVRYVFQEIEDLPAPFRAPAERTKPWGTVQAMLTCKDVVDGPFAVINADDYYGRESYQILSQALDAMDPEKHAYCMAGFKLMNTLSEFGTVTRGICAATPEGILTNVVEVSGLHRQGEKVLLAPGHGELGDLTGDELVSMNFWGFTPAVFTQLDRLFREFLASSLENPKAELVIPNAVGMLVQQGQATVRVLPTGSEWFGITHPQDRIEVVNRLNTLISRGEYPANLWNV
jgi:dTDP-glucose pyrophosphorylase